MHSFAALVAHHSNGTTWYPSTRNNEPPNVNHNYHVAPSTWKQRYAPVNSVHVFSKIRTEFHNWAAGPNQIHHAFFMLFWLRTSTFNFNPVLWSHAHGMSCNYFHQLGGRSNWNHTKGPPSVYVTIFYTTYCCISSPSRPYPLSHYPQWCFFFFNLNTQYRAHNLAWPNQL